MANTLKPHCFGCKREFEKKEEKIKVGKHIYCSECAEKTKKILQEKERREFVKIKKEQEEKELKEKNRSLKEENKFICPLCKKEHKIDDTIVEFHYIKYCKECWNSAKNEQNNFIKKIMDRLVEYYTKTHWDDSNGVLKDNYYSYFQKIALNFYNNLDEYEMTPKNAYIALRYVTDETFSKITDAYGEPYLPEIIIASAIKKYAKANAEFNNILNIQKKNSKVNEEDIIPEIIYIKTSDIEKSNLMKKRLIIENNKRALLESIRKREKNSEE